MRESCCKETKHSSPQFEEKKHNGLGGQGYGKLTDAKIDKMAVYHGRAVKTA
jgi:hypothetical protein